MSLREDTASSPWWLFQRTAEREFRAAEPRAALTQERDGTRCWHAGSAIKRSSFCSMFVFSMRWAVSVRISRLSVLSTVSICLSVSPRHPTLCLITPRKNGKRMKLCQNVLQTYKLRETFFLLTVFSTSSDLSRGLALKKMWIWNWFYFDTALKPHSSTLTMDEPTLTNTYSSVLIVGTGWFKTREE